MKMVKEMISVNQIAKELEETLYAELPEKSEAKAAYKRKVLGNRDLQRKVRKLGPEIYHHIRQQTEIGGNEPLTRAVKRPLENMQKQANILNFDKDTFSLADYDLNIRDALHKHDELKQLMVCGGPYEGEENLEDGAKMMKVIFEILADPDGVGYTLEDALVPLKEFTGALGCPV
jgi:hypothetical protein